MKQGFVRLQGKMNSGAASEQGAGDPMCTLSLLFITVVDL